MINRNMKVYLYKVKDGHNDALDDKKAHWVVYQMQSQPSCLLSSPPNYHRFLEKKKSLFVLMYIEKVILRSTSIAERFFSIQNIFMLN